MGQLYRGRSLGRTAARTGRGMPDNVDPAVGGTRGKKSKEVIDHTAALANLPPAMQALAEKPYLNTKVARKKPTKGKKKTNGLEPIWEYNDLGNDGYYIKPNLPSKDPHGGDASKNKK